MRQSLREHRLEAAALGLTIVASALVAVHGGIAVRVGGDDLYGMYLGKHRLVASTVWAGRLPLWNRWEYCGLPLLGTAQGSVLYAPVVLANLLLDPWVAMQVLYALHAAVLAWSTIHLAVRGGCSLPASLAAVMVAFAGIFTGMARAAADHPHVMFEVCLLPVALLFWDRLLDGHRWAFTALVLTLLAQWLPGYPEPSLDTLVLLATMALFDERRTLPWRLGVTAAAGALGAGMAAIQLLPLAEAVRESVRPARAADYAPLRQLFAFQGPGHALTKVVSRYGGAATVTMLLGLVGAGRSRRLWAAGLAWCLFAANRPLNLLYLVWPFALQQFVWGWNAFAPLFVGLLTARGLDSLGTAGIRIRTVLGASALVSVGAAAAGLHAEAAAALATGALAAAALRHERLAWCRCAILALLAAFVVPVLLHGGTILPFAAPDAAALRGRARLVAEHARAKGLRAIAPEELAAGLVVSEHLPTPMGYEPAVPPRRMERILTLLDLARLVDRSVPNQQFGGPRYRGLVSTLGVGFVVATRAQATDLLARGWVLDRPLGLTHLLLFRAAVPRARVVHEARWVADEEAAFAAVTSGDWDPGRTVVLESSEGTVDMGSGSYEADRVVWLRDEPEDIRIQVTTGQAAMLVVSDNYYPGWIAAVDGVPAAIHRVDYTFRGVEVPTGSHLVVLAYAPMSLRVGAGISVVATLLLTVAAASERRVGATGSGMGA